MMRNYNLRAMLGDVLHELYLPAGKDDRRDVPTSIACDPMAGGQTFLLSDAIAQETLAPSLLLLYGEVEHTGYYDKMSHRAKISSLLKYLWESLEHRPAFRRITQNKESFIKFANGIMNETNTLIATVMQKLPEIRGTQEKMANPQEWGRLSEDEQGVSTSRLEDNEREVKHALPLCNKTLQMFGYLNTDKDIRSLFLLDELCPRLVTMLLHVLTKLVGSKGLDLKVGILACSLRDFHPNYSILALTNYCSFHFICIFRSTIQSNTSSVRRRCLGTCVPSLLCLHLQKYSRSHAPRVGAILIC
jgi:ubiquitin conjugation factor E4 B